MKSYIILNLCYKLFMLCTYMVSLYDTRSINNIETTTRKQKNIRQRKQYLLSNAHVQCPLYIIYGIVLFVSGQKNEINFNNIYKLYKTYVHSIKRTQRIISSFFLLLLLFLLLCFAIFQCLLQILRRSKLNRATQTTQKQQQQNTTFSLHCT